MLAAATAPTAAIPVLHAGGRPGPSTAAAYPDRMAALVRRARRTYTAPGVLLGDRVSAAWLDRCATPYADELRAVSAAVPQRGSVLLNLSYEWACTSGAADDAALGGPTMLRVLDWKFDGLGAHSVAAVVDGAAGRYLSLTWPGYVGVLTAMAPGRFAAAINQPPLIGTGYGLVADWLATRRGVWESRALPASHLLRLAFDTCQSYAEAKHLLETTEICTPVFYTLCGTEPGETCVIERTPTAAAVREGDAATANHWVGSALTGIPRGHDSAARLTQMQGILNGPLDWDLGWLRAPILNPDTRLVAMANPRSGRMVAVGWERHGQATARLDLTLEG